MKQFLHTAVLAGERLHPVEVPGEQEAHLVQWLSRRVGKPLSAPNLTAQGYRLIGGRLLPDGGEAAALFMYENAGGNRLTLYARSGGDEKQTSFRFESQDGVSAFSWIDNGLSYVVSAKAERAQLLPIAETIYRQFEAASDPAKSRLWPRPDISRRPPGRGRRGRRRCRDRRWRSCRPHRA